MALLDTPNESFSNDASIVQSGIVVFATGSNNSVTNNGVMWTTASDQATLHFNASTSDATVINSGYVRGGAAALFFGGSGAIIGNSGEMTGDVTGLNILAGGAVGVSNLFGGTIKGGQTGIMFSAGDTSQINNDGVVYGGVTGISLSGGGLTNSGEVGGSSYGILCEDDSTIVNTNFGGIWSTGTAIAVSGGATIINNADCLITGSQAAITTGDNQVSVGQISLTNFGKIDGKIDCNAGAGSVNDTIVNKDTIKGDVWLGIGSDSFNGAGGTSGKVYGEAGNDTLIGGSAKDVLDGGSGLDKLTGGLGSDQLFGGADRDVFDFNSISESKVGSANRDQILQFQRGTDDIDLRGIDAKGGVSGNQAFKFIGTDSFNGVKGELHYKDLGDKCLVEGDVNGDARADFEILVKASALSAGDFLL